MKCPRCHNDYDIKVLYEKKICKECGAHADLTPMQSNEVARTYAKLTASDSVPPKRNTYRRTDQKNIHAEQKDREKRTVSTVSNGSSPASNASAYPPNDATSTQTYSGVNSVPPASESSDLFQNNTVITPTVSQISVQKETASFDIDIDDDKLFSDFDEEDEDESYYPEDEPDQGYEENEVDDDEPQNVSFSAASSINKEENEPVQKKKKNCAEWMHETLEKRKKDQREQLEFPEMDLNYNKDGYYNDTPVVDTLHADRFNYGFILKFFGVIILLILLVLFLIWYAD